ncbi:MAG: hypothetical protein AB1696_28395 [Planctomycetota bacterium]
MVDRKARNRAAAVVAAFRDSRMSAEELNDAREQIETKDRAVVAVFTNIDMFFCDDFADHRLDGRYALDKDQLAWFDRCLLFLESDNEYAWPPPLPDCPSHPLRATLYIFWNLIAPFVLWLAIPILLILVLLSSLVFGQMNFWPAILAPLGAALLLVGWFCVRSRAWRRAKEAFVAAGDLDVWPFLTRIDYEDALERAKDREFRGHP